MDSLLEPEDHLSQQHLEAPWGAYGRSVTLGVVALGSKFVLNIWNTTYIEGIEAFRQQVLKRPEGVGLITVCNHTR
jgi:monolysocardiolipin acyltransferase